MRTLCQAPGGFLSSLNHVRRMQHWRSFATYCIGFKTNLFRNDGSLDQCSVRCRRQRPSARGDDSINQSVRCISASLEFVGSRPFTCNFPFPRFRPVFSLERKEKGLRRRQTTNKTCKCSSMPFPFQKFRKSQDRSRCTAWGCFPGVFEPPLLS